MGVQEQDSLNSPMGWGRGLCLSTEGLFQTPNDYTEQMEAQGIASNDRCFSRKNVLCDNVLSATSAASLSRQPPASTMTSAPGAPLAQSKTSEDLLWRFFFWPQAKGHIFFLFTSSIGREGLLPLMYAVEGERDHRVNREGQAVRSGAQAQNTA